MRYRSAFGSNVVIGIVMMGISVIVGARPVAAATPNDNCFYFSAGTIINYYQYENNDSANPACPTDVDIPSSIGGVTVTALDRDSFGGNSLTSVTIPSTVTSIGHHAFYYNLLTSITIPDSVTSIDYSAFHGNLLSSVTISNSLTAIADDTFGDNQLTSITIPSSVTSIGRNAFSLNQLTSITIPSSVTAIGDYAFSDNQLTTASIPSSVTSLGSGVFSANKFSSLPAYFSNPSITTIPANTFFGNQFNTLALPGNITTIGDRAFTANKIQSVAIPASIVALGYSPFDHQNPLGGTIFNELLSRDPARSQAALDSIWYVRLTLADASNVHGLHDDVVVANEPRVDLNGNGTTSDYINFGGHVIGVAQATTRFTDSAGTDLLPSILQVGKLNDGTVISNYLVKNGPRMPEPVDSRNPTPAELQAYRDALAAYHRLGDSVNLTAPAITGYSIVTPTSPHSLTLSTPSSNLTFVYSNPVLKIDLATHVTAPVPAVAPAVAQATLVADPTGTCADLTSAQLLAPQGIAAPDTAITIVGGIQFTAQCTTPGGSVPVQIQLGTHYANLGALRVYKQSGTTMTDITSQVTLKNQTVNGVLRTVISYIPVDGAAFDDDAVVNSLINDPIYIGIATAELAATGANLILLVGAGSAVVIVGVILLVVLRSKKHLSR